jgi:hypothetical protein
MPKRFTETKKWDDPWFAELPSKYKLFWLYLLDECDHAGVWKVNFRKANFMIGESLEQSEVLRYLTGRVSKIDESYWMIDKFIQFQYNGLQNDNVGKGVRQILVKHGLIELLESLELGATKPLRSPYVGAQVKDKDKDKVKDKDKELGKSDLLKKKATPTKGDDEFERAWEMMMRRGSKPTALSEWKKLADEDKIQAMAYLPTYVRSVRDKQYLVHFERYLKKRYWDGKDELENDFPWDKQLSIYDALDILKYNTNRSGFDHKKVREWFMANQDWEEKYGGER